MVKKVMVLLSLFCLLSSDMQAVSYEKSMASGSKICSDKNKSPLRRFGSHYGLSVLLSGCIGATTGGLAKCAAKRLNLVKNIDDFSPSELGLVLLLWLLEYECRNDLITMVQRDLDANRIDHHKNLMFRTAWIASWLGYFNVNI